MLRIDMERNQIVEPKTEGEMDGPGWQRRWRRDSAQAGRKQKGGESCGGGQRGD